MPDRGPKYRNLDPTVIPALPGYRIASFGCGEDNKPNEQTGPSDLWVVYSPVIAWIIRPRVKDSGDYSEIDHAEVCPVTAEGIEDSDNDYLVDPAGAWSLPHVATFDGEPQARKSWIDERLARRPDRLLAGRSANLCACLHSTFRGGERLRP